MYNFAFVGSSPEFDMRHLLFALFVAVSVVMAFPTGQIPERINDRGVSKDLAVCLLERDKSTFPILKDRIPTEASSTALWRNYIGCWKIQNDSLFLDSILVPNPAEDYPGFVPAKIDDIYGARRTPSGYFADWVTDTLRVVSGDIVRYRHMGWASDWAKEEYIPVEGGRVKKRIIYINRRVNSVSQDAQKAVVDSLDLGTIPKKIVIEVSCLEFDGKGRPAVGKVEVERSCGDSAVDSLVVHTLEKPEVLARLLPIYLIRGRYQSEPLMIAIPPRP